MLRYRTLLTDHPPSGASSDCLSLCLCLFIMTSPVLLCSFALQRPDSTRRRSHAAWSTYHLFPLCSTPRSRPAFRVWEQSQRAVLVHLIWRGEAILLHPFMHANHVSIARSPFTQYEHAAAAFLVPSCPDDSFSQLSSRHCVYVCVRVCVCPG
jgi:hypothetical protein